MVRKQIMVVTKDDWKLLKTNLNQNKQGKSIHIPSETTVLPLTFALFFVDILLILYLVIVFVYLNCICFSFLFFYLNLHCWKNATRLTRLALPIFYNHLSPLSDEFVKISAPDLFRQN